MTYSIVARDPTSGALGVAVQSKWFSVGGVVSWAEPGVGAVATQAFAEPAYGPRALELMRGGAVATDALAQLLAADSERERRQVALVDATGRPAVHTGSGCIAEAGSAGGAGFSCQANMMLRPTVWTAMAVAFEATEGDLAERMLAALDAAEAEGGDFRGRQSVAMVVVSGDASEDRWRRKVDLRVEDHPNPLAELRRLVDLGRAFDAADRAESSLAAGDGARALGLLDPAPHDDNIDFMRAWALVICGRESEARAVMAELAARSPGWREAAARYAAAGLLPPEVVAALTPPPD